MRRAYHLPVVPLTDAERARQQCHIALARDSEPRGSWVAVARDAVVGFAQALRRQSLWVLSMLGATQHLALELHPGGAVMVRGTIGPPAPNVPSGAFA